MTLRELFGKLVGHQLAAKELSSHAKTSMESSVAYIQDGVALCHKIDADTSETGKVGHVQKGIADGAFNLLVYKDCTTTDGIITECRPFKHLEKGLAASGKCFFGYQRN